MKLLLKTLIAFLCGLLITGAMLFVPAGTLAYCGAWLFIALLFTPILVMGVVLFIKNPELLRKRLKDKEEAKEQDLVVKLSGLMFLVGFIVAGLGFRFGWYSLPHPMVLAAAALFLVAYALYAEVLRENPYLSRTIEVQDGQPIIDTGLYGIVRHPMYSVTLLLFLSMPLVLGSIYSFLIFLAYPLLIAKRIRNEEVVLEKQLDGYEAYKKKVNSAGAKRVY